MPCDLEKCQASFDNCFLRAYQCSGFEKTSRWFKVGLACFLNFATGGVIYGWSSLDPVYISENVSANLCGVNETLPCPAQSFQLGLIFSVASTGNMCAGLPMGLLVDFAGPRIAFVFSELLVLIGATLLAFANSETFNVYIAAFLILGIGGTGVQVSLMHTSNLFPKNKSNVTNAVHACFQLSFLIFALFQFISSNNPKITANHMFLVYAAVVLVCLIAGFFWPGRSYAIVRKARDGSVSRKSPSVILPPQALTSGSASHVATTYGAEPDNEKSLLSVVQHVRNAHKAKQEAGELASDYGATADAGEDAKAEAEAEEEAGDEDNVEDLVVVNTAGVMTTKSVTVNEKRLKSHSMQLRAEGKGKGAGGKQAAFDPVTATFKEQILSGKLWACVFFVTLGIVFSNSFIATLRSNLEAKGKESNLTGMDLNKRVGEYANIFTVLSSVAVVFLPLLGLVMDRLGTASGALVVAIANLLYAGCALLPGLDIQILTFCIYAIGRTFTFSYVFAFVNMEFGLKYFGLLCGIIMVFAGLVNLLLNVIGALLKSGVLTLTDVQEMQLGVYVLSFYFPIYLFISKGCEKKRNERAVTAGRGVSSSAHLDVIREEPDEPNKGAV